MWSVILLLSYFSLNVAYADNAANIKSSVLVDLNKSFEKIGASVMPSVVQIFATGYEAEASSSEIDSGMIARHASSGSGVIVSEDGYIVTNSHVVKGAQHLRVQLSLFMDTQSHSAIKQRQALIPARLVGIDFETDLAVLKIERSGLVPLKLADSDEVRVGHLSLVFGSPRGLDGSVGMGVVSAVARQMKPDSPMVYIQTDAPINPGNSGGPLVNMSGHVIGINTFIISKSGGSEGLGFAIPSNIVSNVYQQIKTVGYVHRGLIGVKAQTISPTLASGLGLDKIRGVILSDVYPGSSAEKAGLLVGDVVLSLNGKTMENARQFDVNLYRVKAGDVVTLKVIRDKQELQLRVTVLERSYDPYRFTQMVSPENNLIKKLGILGLNVDKRTLPLLPPLRMASGVVIAASTNYAPYWAENLKNGDVIHSVNKETVNSLDDLKRILAQSDDKESVFVLQVERDGRLMFIPLEILE